MLFDGKLDAVDLMAIDYCQEERKRKLEQIIDFVFEQDDMFVDIKEICDKLNIKPTTQELSWMQRQIDKA